MLSYANDIFKFIKKTYSLPINSQVMSENSNDKVWYKNIEKYDMESFCK